MAVTKYAKSAALQQAEAKSRLLRTRPKLGNLRDIEKGLADKPPQKKVAWGGQTIQWVWGKLHHTDVALLVFL